MSANQLANNKPMPRRGFSLCRVGGVLASIVGAGVASFGGIGIFAACDEGSLRTLFSATLFFLPGVFMVVLAIVLWFLTLREQNSVRFAGGIGLAEVLVGGVGLAVLSATGIPSGDTTIHEMLWALLPLLLYVLLAVGVPLALAALLAHVRQPWRKVANWPPTPRVVQVARVAGGYCLVAGLVSVCVVPLLAKLKADFRYHSQIRQRSVLCDTALPYGLDPIDRGLAPSDKVLERLREYSITRDTVLWQAILSGVPGLLSLVVSLGAVFEVRQQAARVSEEVANGWAFMAASALGASLFALLLLGGFWAIGGVGMFL